MGLFNIVKKKQPAQPQPQPEPKPEKPQARSKWNDPEYLRRVEAALQQGQSKPIMETLKEAEKPAPTTQTTSGHDTVPKYKWLQSGEWEVQINSQTGKPGIFTKNGKEWFHADEAWASRSGKYYILTGMDANVNEGIAIAEGARGIRIRKTDELIRAATITDNGIGYALSDEGTLFTLSEEKANAKNLCGDSYLVAYDLTTEICAVVYDTDSSYDENDKELPAVIVKVTTLSTSESWKKKIRYSYGDRKTHTFSAKISGNMIRIETPDNVLHEFTPDGTKTK